MKTMNRTVVLGAALGLVCLIAFSIFWRKENAPPAAPGADRPPAATPAVGIRIRPDPGGVTAAAVTDPDGVGTLELVGVVLDPAQSPLGGAQVWVSSTPPRLAVSDENGRFRFGGLFARAYSLEARAGRYYVRPVGVRLDGNAEPVVLHAQAAGSLSVEVRSDRTDAPVAGAQVELRGTVTWRGVTDARGKTELTGVGPGWRVLSVQAPGFAPAALPLTTTSMTEDQTAMVRLEGGAPVSGRVVDASGRPVSGARVWARATAQPFPVVDPALDSVRSDADGRWILLAAPAGTHQFLASDGAHADAATAPIALDGVTPKLDVEIQMSDGGVIAGVVQHKDGSPAPNTEVRLSTLGSNGPSPLRELFTDAGGNFRLGGLPPRGYLLHAWGDRGASAPKEVELAARGDQKVVLTLEHDAALAGIVVSSSGEPVAEAQVQAEAVDRSGERIRGRLPKLALTNSAGRFELGALSEGSYRLRASRPGSPPESLALHRGVLAETGNTEVRIVALEDGGVTGKVVGEDGAPVRRFAVSFDGRTAAHFDTTTGDFSVTTPAGTHDLVIDGPMFVSTVVAKVKVEEGRPTSVGTVKVKVGRSIRGRVLLPDGTPVAGANVIAGTLLTGDGKRLDVASESVGSQRTESDERGRFVLDGFDDRALVAVAEAPGKGRSTSVALGAGTNQIADLVLQPTGALEGMVTRGGKPLADVVVIANPRGANRSNFFVTTGPDGRFGFDALSGGAYAVSAMIQDGNNPRDAHIRAATVEPGQRAKLDIQIPADGLTLKVVVATEGRAAVQASYVALLAGRFDATNVADLRTLYQPPGTGALYVRPARGAEPAQFQRVPPGTYSLCVAVAAVDAGEGSQNAPPPDVERLLVHCTPRELSSDEVITVEVPNNRIAALQPRR